MSTTTRRRSKKDIIDLTEHLIRLGREHFIISLKVEDIEIIFHEEGYQTSYEEEPQEEPQEDKPVLFADSAINRQKHAEKIEKKLEMKKRVAESQGLTVESLDELEN